MTTATLERRVRLLYDASTVQFGDLKASTACTTMDSGRAVITLPRGFDDYYTLQILLHELVHLAMPGQLAAWGTWEEDILVRVAEPNLMHWLVEHPKRHSWWIKRLAVLRDA